MSADCLHILKHHPIAKYIRKKKFHSKNFHENIFSLKSAQKITMFLIESVYELHFQGITYPDIFADIKFQLPILLCER